MVGLAACVSGEEMGLGHKLAALGRGIVQMALSTEGHGARNLAREPDACLLEGWATEERTVVFVRHGESTWNEIFNRGKGAQRFLWMPLRLARGLVREAVALLSPESTFIDSPLSHLGIHQATALRDILRQPDDSSVLLAEALAAGPNTTSVIVSSNLVRAVETVTLALADRLAATGEQVYIRSELQEISRNLDAVALAPPLSAPPSPRSAILREQGDVDLDFGSLYCAEGNRGNKAILGHPRHRMARFAAFCFGDREVDGLACLRSPHSSAAVGGATATTVIAAGHSLWFRTFFRMYVDKEAQHPAKDRKICNAGVVAFTLERGQVTSRVKSAWKREERECALNFTSLLCRSAVACSTASDLPPSASSTGTSCET